MATLWRDHLKAANQTLKRGQKVNDYHLRFRIKSKPNAQGHHDIEVLGYWNGDDAPITARRLHVPLRLAKLERSFELALEETKDLTRVHAMDMPTRRSNAEEKIKTPKHLKTVLAAQLETAEEYLEARARRRKLNTDTLARQKRWLLHCFAHAEEVKQEMSLKLCSEALLDVYGDVERKSYKDSVEIMKSVLSYEKLQLPCGLEEDFKPAYSYEPSIYHDIPNDSVLRERLEAIRDPEQQKLVYAVTVYGHRIMQIYGTKWDTYLPKSGRVRYWSNKVRRQLTAVPILMDGFHLDLSGWTPPRYQELYVYGGQMDAETQRKHRWMTSEISKLIRRTMGVSATMLRHRYCSVSLVNGLHNASTCAAAIGNSIAIISKTYANEIAEYEYRKAAELEQA